MTELKIKILSQEQLKNGESAVEEDMLLGLGELKTMVIVEGGTANGNMSVSFIFKHGNSNFVAHTTENIFEGMNAAFQGAKERFK